MVDLFAGIGSILLGLTGLGLVIFLNRIAKPLGIALEASAKRDGAKALTKVVRKIWTASKALAEAPDLDILRSMKWGDSPRNGGQSPK